VLIPQVMEVVRRLCISSYAEVVPEHALHHDRRSAAAAACEACDLLLLLLLLWRGCCGCFFNRVSVCWLVAAVWKQQPQLPEVQIAGGGIRNLHSSSNNSTGSKQRCQSAKIGQDRAPPHSNCGSLQASAACHLCHATLLGAWCCRDCNAEGGPVYLLSPWCY
jgi:hypothetical protein